MILALIIVTGILDLILIGDFIYCVAQYFNESKKKRLEEKEIEETDIFDL